MCCRSRNKFCDAVWQDSFRKVSKQMSIVYYASSTENNEGKRMNDFKGSSLSSLHCYNFYLRTLRLFKDAPSKCRIEMQNFWMESNFCLTNLLSVSLSAKLLTLRCIFEWKQDVWIIVLKYDEIFQLSLSKIVKRFMLQNL